MKKSKLLLPLTGIMAIGAAAPMVAMTGCSKAKTDFQKDSWETLIKNCKDARTFYNAYLKAADEQDIGSETEAIVAIRAAIAESVAEITTDTDSYRFQRTIPVATAFGEIDMKIRLIDVGHDIGTGEKANKTTFTFEFVDCIGTCFFDQNNCPWMYKWNSTTGKPDEPTKADDCTETSTLKAALNQVYKLVLPESVQNAIVPVTKTTNVCTIKKEGTETGLNNLDFEETLYVADKLEMGVGINATKTWEPSDTTFTFYQYIQKVDGQELNNPLYNKSLYGIEGTENTMYWTRSRVFDSTNHQYAWTNHQIADCVRNRGYGVAPIFNI